MTREQIGVLASCFSSRQERRPPDAGVLAERIDAVFHLREKRADVPPSTSSGEHPDPKRRNHRQNMVWVMPVRGCGFRRTGVRAVGGRTARECHGAIDLPGLDR